MTLLTLLGELHNSLRTYVTVLSSVVKSFAFKVLNADSRIHVWKCMPKQFNEYSLSKQMLASYFAI